MLGKEMFTGTSRDTVPGRTLVKWPCLAPPGPHAWARLCQVSQLGWAFHLGVFRHLGGGRRFSLRLGGLP